MATIKQCDICHTPYEPYGFRKDPQNPNGFSFLNIANCSCGEKPSAYFIKPIDTCKECRDKIVAFIDELMNPPEEEEPESPEEGDQNNGENEDTGTNAE